ARQPGVLCLWHAVLTPQVASVGDRKAEVPKRATQRVEQHDLIISASRGVAQVVDIHPALSQPQHGEARPGAGDEWPRRDLSLELRPPAGNRLRARWTSSIGGDAIAAEQI